jgi:8-oxo-dGTP pyrophosphatase MutT (NUDIX family)
MGVSDDGSADRREASQTELVEVVDGDGAVVAVTSRRRIRAERLRHRCTYVVVVTTSDELVVHQRADWKDIHPGYWDVCFGGICGVGESWEASAVRELAEEAGLTGVDLEDLGPVHYDQADGAIIGRVYLARTDLPPSCPDGEVVAVDRVPISGLHRWLVDRPVCPDSRWAALPAALRHLGIGPEGFSE